MYALADNPVYRR